MWVAILRCRSGGENKIDIDRYGRKLNSFGKDRGKEIY